MMPDPVPDHPTPGMALWGWMTPIELEWLGNQAANMAAIVEVGSLHGRSSWALADACPGPVYCIDPFLDGAWESWTASVGDRLPNAVPVRGYSPDAGRRIPGPIDMVFLDGAHDHDSVVADITYWAPRTRILLCGHDYHHADYPDVATVVDDIFGDNAMVAPGTNIWYRRTRID